MGGLPFGLNQIRSIIGSVPFDFTISFQILELVWMEQKLNRLNLRIFFF